jgi:hypothetical protein
MLASRDEDAARSAHSQEPKVKNLGLGVSWMVAVVAFVPTCIVIAVIALIACSPTWPQLVGLAHDGRQITATVNATEYSDHGSCDFEYTVVGVLYHGSDACGPVVIGQPIAVTYDPGNPAVVITGNPANRLDSDLVVALIALIAFPTIVTIGLRNGYRALANADSWSDVIRRARR